MKNQKNTTSNDHAIKEEDDEIFFDAKESWESPPPNKNSTHFSRASTVYSQDKPTAIFQKNHTTNFSKNYKKQMSFKEISTIGSDDSKNYEEGACRTHKHVTELLNEIPVFQKQEEVKLKLSPENCYRSKPLMTIKTKKEYKDEYEFNGISLEQEVQCGTKAIWVARFSADGTYLATSGEDGIVRIWEAGNFNSKPAEQLFDSKPMREYKLHTKGVLDLSWCFSNPSLLISVGLDCRIVLWNINKVSDPEQILLVSEPVTSVSFMSDSNEYFATGSCDMIVRLWSISSQSILDWQKTTDIITSVKFSPDGKKLLVGLYKGICPVYSQENLKLKYLSSIECKNARGEFSCGKKVTGIYFKNNIEALVTTADSRLRLINLEDFSQKYKYKGHKMVEGQMNAMMSEDEDYVISGSEDGNVVIWNRLNTYIPAINPIYTGYNKEHNGSIETFQPFHGTAVTNAQFAPLSVLQKASKLLTQSSPPALVKQIIIACSAQGQMNIYYQLVELV